MQQRARHRDVAVDTRERRADRADRLGDAEAVLEQPVAVGLVVVLRRRRLTVTGPQRRVLAEHPVQQQPEVWLLDGCEQLSHLTLHLLDTAYRTIQQIINRKSSRLRGLETAQVDLRAKAWMNRVSAAHAHRRSRARQLLDLGQLLPDHARKRARAVAQLQAQVVAAVAPLAPLGRAHEQNLVDLEAVCELVDEHCLKVDVSADETLRCARGSAPRLCAGDRLELT